MATNHIIVKWNPYDDFEPHTIEAHARMIDQGLGFCWWGKIEKTGPNLTFKKHLRSLNAQIQKGIETHLYLYCPYSNHQPALHVAKVERICLSSQRDHPELTPPYYARLQKLHLKARYWFQISDIRRLSPDPQPYLPHYDPVAADQYPKLVTEKQEFAFFDYSITRGKKWCVVQRLDAILRLPGDK